MESKNLPKWAERGNFRYARMDGGPIEVHKALVSGWDYMEFPINSYACNIAYDGDRLIDIIKDAYVNWIWITWSVGFSWETEEIQREIAKKFIAKCHKNNIKVTSYHSLANVFIKDYEKFNPKIRSWIQKKKNGKLYTYGAVRSDKEGQRYLVCINNPNWKKHIKKTVKSAVEAGVDAIYFDNCYISCYCNICNKKFKLHTKKLLGKEYNLSKQINANDRLKGSQAQQINDDFFSMQIADFLREIKNHVSKVNKNILLYSNAHERIIFDEAGDYTLSEDCAIPNYDSKNGYTINSGILRYLYADGGADKPNKVGLHQLPWSMAYIAQVNLSEMILDIDVFKLSIAESACYGSSFYFTPEGIFLTKLMLNDKLVVETWKKMGEYNKFLEENSQYYNRLYQEAKIVFIVDTIRDKIDFFQYISENKIIFEIIPIEYFNNINIISKFKVIIPTQTKALSAKQVNILNKYQNNKGKIIGIDPIGTHNEVYAKRNKRDIEEIFKNKESILFTDGIQGIMKTKSSKQKFIDILTKAEEEPIIEIDKNLPVIPNIMSSDKKRIKVIHLLNYSKKKINNIKIKLNNINVDKNSLSVISPDNVKKNLLNFKNTGNSIEFTLSEIHIYSLVIIKY